MESFKILSVLFGMFSKHVILPNYGGENSIKITCVSYVFISREEFFVILSFELRL